MPDIATSLERSLARLPDGSSPACHQPKRGTSLVHIPWQNEGQGLYLRGLNDGQQGILDGSSHVGGIAAHIEMRASLQKPPNQTAALP